MTLQKHRIPLSFFKRFAGKLTLLQAFITLTALLITALILQTLSYFSGVESVQDDLIKFTENVERYNTKLDQSDKYSALDEIVSAFTFLAEIRSSSSTTTFILTDLEGRVLASSNLAKLASQQMLFENDNSKQGFLSSALAGKSTYSNISLWRFNIFNDLFAATPIKFNGVVQGVVFLHFRMTFLLFLQDFLETLVGVLAVFVLVTLPFIIYVGKKQGNSLADRLASLAKVAKKWARGDLSQLINDDHQDELTDLSTDLNAMASQFQILLKTEQELAVLKERNRLALELHDSVKQQVFAVGLKIATLEEKPVEPDYAITLKQIQALVQNIKEELSRLIYKLKPSALERASFLTALKRYLADWSNNHAIPIQLDILGSASLPADIEQSLFRITQEALANILKHSQASHVTVKLDFSNTFTLSIIDNGQGFNTQQSFRGLGLQAMKERSEEMGGRFSLSSIPSKGTVIRVYCYSQLSGGIK